VELLGIEAVNTPAYHEPPPETFHEPVPEGAPLRMEAGPLDRYNLKDAVLRRPRVANGEAARHAAN
jgi:hypothetical protein